VKSIELAIGDLLESITRNPDAEDDVVVSELVAAGTTELDAERLIAFVPSACGRAVLSNLGAQFPEEYIVRDYVSGREAWGRLRDEPVFQAAQAFIRAQGVASEAVRRLAARSAEMNAAEELRRGDRADGVRFVEAVLLRLPVNSVRSPTRLSSIAGPKLKPWWRPW